MNIIMEKQSLGSTAISNGTFAVSLVEGLGGGQYHEEGVLCKDNTGSLVDKDVQREVGAGGSKPYRKPVPMRRKMRAWTSE